MGAVKEKYLNNKEYEELMETYESQGEREEEDSELTYDNIGKG